VAENKPDDHPDKRQRSPLAIGLLRACWPLPGALAGASISFHLYFRQPGLNTDTAAPLIFASVWALCGLLSGFLISGIAGWLIERGLLRGLPNHPLLATSLTLVCLTGLCWGLSAPLEARLPALFWPAPQKVTLPLPPKPSPCLQTAPTDRQARQAWELECR